MKIPSFFFTLFLINIGLLSIINPVVCQETTATAEATTTSNEASATTTSTTEEASESTSTSESDPNNESGTYSSGTEAFENVQNEPVQAGPLIDLLGTQLYSMEIVDQTSAQISAHYTNEVLAKKKVIGLYFSADWCGPCRQFTPELVSFYEKMNSRRGKKDQFQIVWISRCRDVNSYAQYFTQMPWLALPPEEAMGPRGQVLSDKYKVKSIPTLVLIDDLGNTITTDARNKIPADKAGVGFPWRSPLSQMITTLVPRSLRLLIKTQIDSVKTKIIMKLKSMVGLGPKKTAA